MAKTNTDTISTSHTDTVAQFTPMYPNGIPPLRGNDSVVEPLASLPVMPEPQGSSAAMSHSRGPLYDTGSMSLLLLSAFFIVVCFKSGYVYLENFAHNLLSVRRRRETIFDNHTMGDVRMMWALVANTCVMEGLLLFYAIGLFVPSLRQGMLESVFLYVGVLTAMCMGFHLCQHALYALLGYVFGDPLSRKLWLSGFWASQSLLGLLLFPVTVFLLLFPSAIELLLTVAAILYGIVRIVFIFKGLRIFFNKLSQSLYFILYLCSMEIVPLVLYAALLVAVCTKLQS